MTVSPWSPGFNMRDHISPAEYLLDRLKSLPFMSLGPSTTQLWSTGGLLFRSSKSSWCDCSHIWPTLCSGHVVYKGEVIQRHGERKDNPQQWTSQVQPITCSLQILVSWHWGQLETERNANWWFAIVSALSVNKSVPLGLSYNTFVINHGTVLI